MEDNTITIDTGYLYNYYAVETGKLAPTGYRVPSNDDFTTLVNYLIANGYNYDDTTTGNKIAKSLCVSVFNRLIIFLFFNVLGCRGRSFVS